MLIIQARSECDNSTDIIGSKTFSSDYIDLILFSGCVNEHCPKSYECNTNYKCCLSLKRPGQAAKIPVPDEVNITSAFTVKPTSTPPKENTTVS